MQENICILVTSAYQCSHYNWGLATIQGPKHSCKPFNGIKYEQNNSSMQAVYIHTNMHIMIYTQFVS